MKTLKKSLARAMASSLIVLQGAACDPVALGPARETHRTLLRASEVTVDERTVQAELQVRDGAVAVYGWKACTTDVRVRSDYRVVVERERETSHGGLMWFPFILGAAFVGLGSAMLANPRGFVDAAPPESGPATNADGSKACRGACDVKDARAGGYVLLALGSPFLLWPILEGIRALGVNRERRQVSELGPPLRRVGSCGDEPLVGAQVTLRGPDGQAEPLGLLDRTGKLQLSLPTLGASAPRGGVFELTVGESSAGRLVMPEAP